MPLFFALLIPFALIICCAYNLILSFKTSKVKQLTSKLQQNYLIGLNYLLNEQPDRAVDVFIKAIDVDVATIETHLALGILFRKKGEVERAIRIHQNLIARPQLTLAQRLEVLLELGRDYLSAGMLDRAEGLFIEMIGMGKPTEAAFMHLLEIYELEKNWQMAIETAKKLQNSSKKIMALAIGHYYCELAEEAIHNNAWLIAHTYIKQALAIDRKSVRASLLLGKYQLQFGNYVAAISAYESVELQNSSYLSEIIKPLLFCYKQLHKEEQWLIYMQSCYQRHPHLTLAIAIANFLYNVGDYRQAYQVIITHLQQESSVLGVVQLLKIQIAQPAIDKQALIVVQKLLNELLIKQANYQCQKCGFSGKKLLWLCPGCHAWSTIKPLNLTHDE